MDLTQAEYRHLASILIEYIRRPDYLKQTINVLDNTVVTTDQVLAKVAQIATEIPEPMNFNVRNHEIEQTQRKIGDYIRSQIPRGWGFALFLFTFGEKGNLFYISNAQREDMIKTMKEFIQRNIQ